MSEPMVLTDEVRSRSCRCGTQTTERRLVGLYGSTRWQIEGHDGPCGKPCICGGVRPASAYGLGQYHPIHIACPHCEVLT